MSKNTKTSAHENMPQVYIDMRSTAQFYLYLGPDKYQELFGENKQLEPLSQDEMDTTVLGMQQIMEGCGLTQENPFTGLDIHGFYVLADVLGLEMESQALLVGNTEDFLDRMEMVDLKTEEKIFLYNLVPSPDARRAMEANGGRALRVEADQPCLRKTLKTKQKGRQQNAYPKTENTDGAATGTQQIPICSLHMRSNDG